MTEKIKKILIAQPQPAPGVKTPFDDVVAKNGLKLDYKPLLQIQEVSAKEFRSQHLNLTDFTAVVFTSRKTIDSYFHLCESMRISVPETMKYICSTEAYALYLQKYIVYRKRKISFADGSSAGLIDLITKHKDENILLAMSDPHKPELPEKLEAMNIKFSLGILARTVAADIDPEHLSKYDMAVLYSPWDVKAVCDKCSIDNLPVIATFGEGALKEATAKGIKVAASAPTKEAPSMAKALEIYLQGQKKAIKAAAKK